MTRILIVAETGPGALGESYRSAFARAGHEVISFDHVEQSRRHSPILTSRVGGRLFRGSWSVRRALSHRYNEALLQAQADSRAEIVLIFSGQYIFPQTVHALRRQGARVGYYQADNPFPPHSTSRPESIPVAQTCDRYFVWSDRLALQLRSIGVNAHYVPFGWDPELMPYIPDATESEKVVFIGGWDPERATFLEQILRHFDLEIWGSDYWGSRTPRSSLLRRAWKGRGVPGSEFAAISRNAHVMLNILRTQHTIGGVFDGVIMRTFEVPGTGGFLLSTRTEGATRIFPEGRSGAFFSSVEECIQQLRMFMRNRSVRDEIRLRAHEEVSERHRYDDRAREILALM